MKKIFKKGLSIFLCTLIVFSSLGTVVAFAVGYPDGVTEKKALNAIDGTDTLLENAVPTMTGKSLSALISETLYSDSTLSNLLLGIYTSMEEQGDMISSLGIDCSTSALAYALSAYPDVSEAVKKSGSWSKVKLDGVSWGVSDKADFTDALSEILSPFNGLLYALLCDGDYKMNRFITVNGDHGYGNSIIPLLNAIGCENVMSQSLFELEAKENPNNMIKNIMGAVLTLVERIAANPADELTGILPEFGYFVDSGEFNSCYQKLLSPITSNPLVEIAVFLDVFGLKSLVNLDPNQLITSLGEGAEGGLKLAEIDFNAFASCGEMTDKGYVPDKGLAFVELVKWLGACLELNADGLGTQGGLSLTNSDMLVNIVINLFNTVALPEAQGMLYPEFTSGSVENTTKLTDANLEKVYNQIDGLLDQFVKEGGVNNSIGEIISSSIYTNANLSSVVIGIYGAMEEAGLTSVLQLMGIDATPKGVASKVTGYGNASGVLNGASSWAKVSPESLTWGIYSGSRRNFQNALTASLRPLMPVLRALLAGQDMVIMGSATVPGNDGYNTAVIPLLEALGCNPDSILTYRDFKSKANGDGVLNNILNPVFDLIDSLAAEPVKTIIDVIPNIVYFAQSGSLEKCIENLLLPLSAIMGEDLASMGLSFDISSLMGDLDINSLVGSLLGDGIKMAELDFELLTSLGTPVEKVSKAVKAGQSVKYTYIESNKSSIVFLILKFVSQTMKLPGNDQLLMGLMGDSGNMAFDISSITAELENKTEDEFIEWIYNLFFKDRVVSQKVEAEKYSPNIIYEPEEEKISPVAVVLIVLVFVGAAAVGVVFFTKKKPFAKA